MSACDRPGRGGKVSPTGAVISPRMWTRTCDRSATCGVPMGRRTAPQWRDDTRSALVDAMIRHLNNESAVCSSTMESDTTVSRFASKPTGTTSVTRRSTWRLRLQSRGYVC